MLIRGLFDFALMVSIVALGTSRSPTAEGDSSLSLPVGFVAPLVFISPISSAASGCCGAPGN